MLLKRLPRAPQPAPDTPIKLPTDENAFSINK